MHDAEIRSFQSGELLGRFEQRHVSLIDPVEIGHRGPCILTIYVDSFWHSAVPQVELMGEGQKEDQIGGVRDANGKAMAADTCPAQHVEWSEEDTFLQSCKPS